MTNESAALATREYEAEEIERAGGRERLPAAARQAHGGLTSIGQSSDVTLLLPAYARAQMSFPTIVKDRVAKIEGRGNYTYKYANLADVQNVVNPILQENGLSFMMVPRGARLIGRLIHESGQFIEGDLPLVQPDSRANAQAVGSALTYAKRYLMSSMLGLVLDDFDDDGAAASGARTAPVAAARDPGAHTGHRAKAPPSREPSVAELGESLESATTADAVENVLRLAGQRPKLIAAAWGKLVALARKRGDLDKIGRRIKSDTRLPEDLKGKLFERADLRALALEEAQQGQAADDIEERGGERMMGDEA